MHISIDNETSPMEMHHIAVALQRIAAERGYKAPVEPGRTQLSETRTVGEMSIKVDIDTTDATTAIETLAAHAAANNVSVEVLPPVTVSVDYSTETPSININHASIDDAGNVSVSFTPATTDTHLDSSGLPWDARIHAGSRERNTDGSWRVRRRPKDTDQDAWDATLARVTAELTDLMTIPVSPGAVADAAAEEALTDDEVDAFVDIVQGVVVAPPVTIAPPVVVPPVTAVAPPITVTIETFAQLMSWLTSRTPKNEAAKPAMVTRVNEILAANGLTTLQQLGQRADLIPQVLAQFREAFGE